MRQRKKGTHDRFSPNKAKQESSPLSSEVVDPVEEDEEDKDVLPEPWPRLVIAQKTDLIVGAVVFLISLVVFTLTLCPSVPGGDAGELITCACNAGIPHPPGYPTLLILGRFVLTILPFGTPAWKMNFLSAVCSATAALFIYLTALDMTRASRAAAGTAALSWAFSPLIWEYSVTAEVFSLNNCMTSIFLFIYGRNCLEREKEAAFGVGDSCHTSRFYLRCGAFMVGLGLTNQHTLSLFAIPLILMVVCQEIERLSIAWIGLVTFDFLCGMSPYLLLVIQSVTPPIFSWGNLASVDGFLTHFLRSEYGTFSLAPSETDDTPSLAAILMRMTFYGSQCLLDFGWVEMSMVVVGLVGCWWFLGSRAHGWIRLGHFLAMILYLGVFAFRANLDVQSPLFRGVVARFWQQPHVLLALWIALGMAICLSVFQRLTSAHQNKNKNQSKSSGVSQHDSRQRQMYTMLGYVCLCLLLGLHLYQTAPRMNHSRADIIAKYGHDLLMSLPPGAMLLTRGDLTINAVRYWQVCEGQRPDIDIMDQEMMSYDWFASQNGAYPRMHFPQSGFYHPYKGGFSMAQLLAANDHRPLFLARGWKEGDTSQIQEGWTTAPWGLAERIYPSKREALEAPGLTSMSICNSSSVWPLYCGEWGSPCYDGSWAKEALATYADSCTQLAVHRILQVMAAGTDGPTLTLDEQQHLLQASLHDFQVYFESIKSMNLDPGHYAAGWKNVGIVASRLAEIRQKQGDGSGFMEMSQLAAKYWKKFLRTEDSKNDPARDQLLSYVQYVAKRSAGS